MEHADEYDALLVRWGVPVEPRDVDTPHGRTRVHLSGDPGSPPVVLLPGGGATSSAWFAVAGPLSDRYRVMAIDLVGDVGRTTPGARPVRTATDATTWLVEVLDALCIASAAVVGHSYGGWLALRLALDHPDRVARLALLDPSQCFTGMRPSYLAHALPILLKPSPARAERFLRWETGDAIDPGFLRLWRSRPRSAGVVRPRRPHPAELAALPVPVLVLAAGRSRQHDVVKLVAGARALPDVRVVTVARATHHQLPTEHAAEVVPALRSFLDGHQPPNG